MLTKFIGAVSFFPGAPKFGTWHKQFATKTQRKDSFFRRYFSVFQNLQKNVLIPHLNFSCHAKQFSTSARICSKTLCLFCSTTTLIHTGTKSWDLLIEACCSSRDVRLILFTVVLYWQYCVCFFHKSGVYEFGEHCSTNEANSSGNFTSIYEKLRGTFSFAFAKTKLLELEAWFEEKDYLNNESN